MISYILWDGSSEILSLGQFTFRWDTLSLVLAFLLSRQILLHIYKKEGRPFNGVDTLTAYLIIAVILGARLGYVIFYQPELLWSKPIDIFLPFQFQPVFRFTGMKGFSIHGGALGILIALWIFGRRNEQAPNYLQVLDRIVILAALAGALIFAGNFLNSEIAGKPTNSASGTIFINPVTKGLLKIPCCIMRNPNGNNPLDFIKAKKGETLSKSAEGHKSIILYLFFKPGASVQLIDEFLRGDVKAYLYDMSQFVYEPGTEPIHYTIFEEAPGDYVVRVTTIGIARLPVPLFESITCFLLFIVMFWYWNKRKITTPPGRIFGFFMILFWSLHFAFEYLKEPAFEKGMALHRGQILDIPLILMGVAILILSYRKNAGNKG